MQPNIVIEQLSLQMSPLDASYMPSTVVIMTGQTVGELKEMKTCLIPSNVREFLLLSGQSEVSETRVVRCLQ